jgi:hypothetical protein
MSAYKIVQKITPLTMTGGITTSNPIALKSGYLRIVPEQDAYIEVSSSPTISTSTNASVFVKGGTEFLIKETVIAQTVVAVQTGTATTVTIPEGTFSDFSSGDIVELTGIVPSGINTTSATVASVDATNDAGTGGFNRIITLNWDTSTQGAAITTPTGVLRRVTKVAASAASGKVHITEVQIAGG